MPPNTYLAPAGPLATLETALGDATILRRLRRRIMRRLPLPILASDVRDIVYAHWIVPLAQVAPFVPPRIGVVARDDMTILTVLTYRHGHFGPERLGPLRRLLPSPLQSNWRLYVDTFDGAAPPQPTVLFLRNLFDTRLHAVGTRLMSDILPSHRPPGFVHRCTDDMCETIIAEGGSAPGLHLVARPGPDTMPPPFAAFFADRAGALASLCRQDAAIAAIDDDPRLAIGGIDLPIDPATARSLAVTDYRPGTLLRTLGADAPPWCVRIPAVRFRALGERLI